jgi:hypothetical protein
MSTGNYLHMLCAGCGAPIQDASFILSGSATYHNQCRPPGYVVSSPPSPPPLTADLLRLIVREEVAKLLKEHLSASPTATPKQE